MKLPYRAGDYFALPLGDGSHARAHIVRARHHVVDVAVGDAVVRTIDKALVQRRWRLERSAGRTSGETNPDPPHAGRIWTPAHVERFFAGREIAPLRIHEGRFTPEYACARNDEELRSLAARNVESLIVGGSVRIESIASLFPQVRALRIAERGMPVDARELARCASLEILDCSGVALAHDDALAGLARLRGLRIARVHTFDVRSLEGVNVRALAFESIADLRNAEEIAKRDELEQLELLDLWPCDLNELMPLTALPRLVRAEIDIGGRRKNVELYRRANWAYPWPSALL